MKKPKKFVIVLIITLLLCHGPVGGFCAQAIVSAGSYLGICIGCMFSDRLHKDMQEINYNPFNNNAQKTAQMSAVSFYKGVPFYRMRGNRAGSFCAVLLSPDCNANDVRHEVGHNVQQLILGPVTFLAIIGVPSFFELSARSYYNRPWEVTADMFGGVKNRTHTSADLNRGRAYLAIAFFVGPGAYFFLIGEY